MLILFILSVFVGVKGDPYGCPTNVTCIEKETCCETSTGLWACCPMESGVCCDDGLHCCSKGQKCLPNGNCSSSSNDIFPALPLKIHQIEMTSVQCPDGNSCPSGNSCCQLSSGQYGCCPIRDAVCCSDHLHCCPSGYTCDVEHSKCQKKFDDLNDVPCPGGSSACPDGETCCKLESGDYGCCPLADAVCCSDHLHCCPHGYTCDVEQGQCLQEISIPWFTKTASFRREQDIEDINANKEIPISDLNVSFESDGKILCPDAKSECPSASTCCLATDESWGCCPIEDAVCCSDHIHCCPAHFICDLHVFKCDHSIFGSIPMLKKQPSLNSISSKLILSKFESSISTIQCPDEISYCPEETTCCQIENDSYGCCPYPEASCCSDKIHCCENGYSCDKSGERCIRQLNLLNKTERIPSRLKFASNKIELLIPLKDETCPDGITKCSLNTTCCPNKENDRITYSCCPYSKGVCCGTNGSICCPNNYICDEKQLSCQLNDLNLVRSLSTEIDYSQCGTSDLGCSFDQTCCRTYGSSDGEYACCAFPQGECCEDGRHCCPKGSKCDTQYGGCIQQF